MSQPAMSGKQREENFELGSRISTGGNRALLAQEQELLHLPTDRPERRGIYLELVSVRVPSDPSMAPGIARPRKLRGSKELARAPTSWA